VEPPADDGTQATEAAGIAVGSRCEVQPGGKRGIVAYVGNTQAPGLPRGWWVGVRFDEPVGKNDGSFGGIRFFDCPSGYGGLIRPAKVTTGDFPEVDPFEDDDEM
jgi:tubulin-specific chaperone B